MATKKVEQIKVTLVKSTIAILPEHKKVVEALGLKKIRSYNVLPANASVLGMIDKVKYLVKVEQC